jgi:uroporphyrinogen-III decarboxylase
MCIRDRVYHSDGKLDAVLPVLHEIGFAAVHPVAPECNDIFALRQRWAGKMAFIGNIPTMLLAYGSLDQVEERVRRSCADLAAGGGYVLGSSTSIMEGIPPENFVTMVQAAHRFGHYGSLGADAAFAVPLPARQASVI